MTRQDTLRQTIKWIVYSLLIVNWGYYVFDDWRAAQHTLGASEPLIRWMSAYATSIDELAWFALLFLFEAETYWLSDDALTRIKRFIFVGIRIACYAFLLHTLYAFSVYYLDVVNATLFSSTTTLCDLAGQDFSFLRNLAYTDLDAGNCGTLASGVQLFQVGTDLVVTDAAGLSVELGLAIIDLIDASAWLLVVIIIELVVVAQERGVTGGPFIVATKYLLIALYSILLFTAAYWSWRGHYVYTWDQLLWIGGFAAIGMNLSDWREELDQAAVAD